MDAIFVTEYGGADVLTRGTRPMPAPRPSDVVVENRAIGVNPIDFKVRAGALGAPVSEDDPLIVGWDAAGVVHAVGDEVRDFQPGDAVYYAGDVGRPGTYARYTAVDARAVARMPASMSFEQAAAVPLAAETAWETIVEDMRAEPGQSILVYNGAGGVGSMAIQLAKARGLTVVATASRDESIAWCKKMGADYVISHREDISPQLARVGLDSGVDFIFHLHEPDNIADLVKSLKPLGQISLTWAPSADAMAKIDTLAMFFKRQTIRFTLMFTRLMHDVKPHMQGRLLADVAKLIDDGKIVDIVTKTMSWADVREAHTLQESGGKVGKTVMTVD